MTTAIIIAVVSGGVLAALTLLFKLEQKRERRFLLPLRTILDVLVTTLTQGVAAIGRVFGTGRLWRYGRYGLLFVVEGTLVVLNRLEQFFLRIHRRQNKTLRSTSASRTDGHLGEVSAHKREMALSQAEKDRLREEMLE